MPDLYQDSNNLQDSDNRYFPRWEVQKNILFEVQDRYGEFHSGTTRDLSCSGACLTLPKRITPNQKINLTIFLSENKYVHVQGNIVWVKNSGREVQAGVAFYNTSPLAQDMLLEHAFELNRNELKERLFKGWD